MIKFIDYDPEKHKNKKLYILQSEYTGSVIASVAIPVNTPHEVARQTPWYYVVEAENEEGAD